MKKIWHVMMPESTVTFLYYDEVQKFIAPMLLGNLIERVLIVDSDVTDEQFNMLHRWHEEGIRTEV